MYPGQTQPGSGPDGTRLEPLTHAVLASRPGILSDSATNAAGFLILPQLLMILPLLPKRTNVQPRKPSLMLCWRRRDVEVNPKVTQNNYPPCTTVTHKHYAA